MDFYSSVVYSMNANGKNRQKHTLSRYELTRQTIDSQRMYYTIDKGIEIAYKVMVYINDRFPPIRFRGFEINNYNRLESKK